MPGKIVGQILLEAVLRHMEDEEKIWDCQHSFTRGKSCLTKPVPFYDGVTTSVVKGMATGVICLGFCKAFNMVPHIFPSKLERDGFDGWAVWWIRNRWDGHIQRVVVNGSGFQWTSVISHVLQGLILEQVLFNIFINYIDEGIDCTLSRFSHNTKQSGVVDVPEAWDTTQRDLGKLKR